MLNEGNLRSSLSYCDVRTPTTKATKVQFLGRARDGARGPMVEMEAQFAFTHDSFRSDMVSSNLFPGRPS